MTGLQRECPRCGELNRPDGYVCLECGAWLVEPRQLDQDELERVLGEWYRTDRPRRVDDPERREAEIREWDESREREQREHDRVAELWRRRRERWKKDDRGDTAQGAPADTARPKGTT